MKPPINVQILEQDGVPAFAVIPYNDFLSAFPDYKEDNAIPHEVVGLVIKKGYNLVKAWRVYLGKKQREVAKKAGITQAALSQMERAENPNRSATLEKLAAAMDISVELLRD